MTRCSGSSAFSVPKRAALVTIISVSPMMALSGVRSSWLTLETNCDLCSLAIRELAALVLDFVEQAGHSGSRCTAWAAKVRDQIDGVLGEMRTWRSLRMTPTSAPPSRSGREYGTTSRA